MFTKETSYCGQKWAKQNIEERKLVFAIKDNSATPRQLDTQGFS